MSKSYPAKIEFEIKPLEDDHEVEMVVELLDDEGDSESVHDGQEIINPYTGELEKKSKYPEVEYLDLENVQDTEQAEIETAPLNPKTALKRQRQLWRETNKHEWLNIYHQFMEARAKETKKRGGPLAVPEQWSKKIIRRKPMKSSKPQVVFENTKTDDHSVHSKRKSKRNVKSVKKSKLQKSANEIMEEYVNNKISDFYQEEPSEVDEFGLEEETTTEGQTVDTEKSDGIKLQECKKRLLEEFRIEDEAAEVTPKEGTTNLDMEQGDNDLKDSEMEIHKKRLLEEVTLDDGAAGAGSVTIKVERHTSKEDLTDEVNAENYGEVEFLEEAITPNDDTDQQTKGQRTSKRKQTKWKIKTVRQLKQSATGKGASRRQYRLPRLFHGDLDPQASVLADPQNHITQRNSLEALRIDTIKLIKYSNLCLFKWGKDLLACFYCQQRFKHMSMLREHTKSDHDFKDIIWKFTPQFYKADISDLTCTRCNYDFDSLKELQAHLSGDHRVKFRTGGSFLVPYKLCTDTITCQVCGKDLSSRGLLQRHMKSHILKFTCESCNAIFIDEKSMKQHKCVKRELKECRVCGESFNSNGERRHHEVKVHDFRSKVMLKFKCSYCSQRFRYNYKKVKHMIDAHGAESEMYQCSYCPQVFITVHWCSKHMNRAHRDLILGLKKK